jgi:hypothetical protein
LYTLTGEQRESGSDAAFTLTEQPAIRLFVVSSLREQVVYVEEGKTGRRRFLKLKLILSLLPLFRVASAFVGPLAGNFMKGTACAFPSSGGNQ